MRFPHVVGRSARGTLKASSASSSPTMRRMRVPSIFRQEPILWPLLLLLFLVYLIPHTTIPGRIRVKAQQKLNSLPDFKVDFHPSKTFLNRFSTNKTVLYIETRDNVAHVTPLLLHMTQVIPPEWRFVFLGTDSLVHRVNRSSPVQRMIDIGKLRLGSVERWTNRWKSMPDLNEVHSRLLTNLTFYDEQLPGVEWLLVFRSSAIICANSDRTVNDYLEYDWVGAPWNIDDKFGGNGGLSLRRLSRVREVLQFQERLDDTASEDRWLSSRIGLLPDSNPANGSVEQGFAVEDVWSANPLGYHVNPVLGPGKSEDVWNLHEKRRYIYEYCPEVKIIMPMRLERERCPVENEEVDPDSGVEAHRPDGSDDDSTTSSSSSVRRGGVIKRRNYNCNNDNHEARFEKKPVVMDAVEAEVDAIQVAGAQDSSSPREMVRSVLRARASSSLMSSSTATSGRTVDL